MRPRPLSLVAAITRDRHRVEVRAEAGEMGPELARIGWYATFFNPRLLRSYAHRIRRRFGLTKNWHVNY